MALAGRPLTKNGLLAFYRETVKEEKKDEKIIRCH